MRELIIPDVHDDIIVAKRILDRVPHDHAIFLGDFFDDWRTNQDDALQTARQVKEWLNDPTITVLLGNHDMSYGWGHINSQHICSGWTKEKAKAIHSVLGPEDWQKFRLHAWLDGNDYPWLVSHAGIAPALLDNEEPENYRSLVDHYSAQAWECLNTAQNHFLLGVGRIRGGRQRIGGINWMDWAELDPIPGLNQLVGHTFLKQVRLKGVPPGDESLGTDNICIDTRLRHYAVLEDGEMTVYETKELKKT